MQELKQLVAGRVEASPEEEPVVGASKLHGEAPLEGVLDACDVFLKKESCALPKGSKHWGPVTWMDPKVGKPGRFL